jgi:2-keto-4-pentenoate hydratase/2-oxohepta-3-ene-1,7-dioic acid hydratase in catechol pathway
METLLVKLVTFAHPAGPRPGAVIPATSGDRVVDLWLVASTVVEIISSAALLASAQIMVNRATTTVALDEVVLLPPVQPGKIVCLGYNYRGHVPVGDDATASDPEFMDVFVKTPNVLAAPGDPVVLPAASTHVDYEGEIALVIGTRAKEVSLDDAMNYVAGYTLFNDVTDRDWQARQSQWELGKCFDGFGPLGPVLTTADEIADPHDLLVEVLRDGIVTVSQNTSTMIFRMAYVIHYLSQVMTLEPGDIVSTGTPQKLPEALEMHRPLADGDSVTVRVAGLGELTTTFISPIDHHDS